LSRSRSRLHFGEQQWRQEVVTHGVGLAIGAADHEVGRHVGDFFCDQPVLRHAATLVVVRLVQEAHGTQRLHRALDVGKRLDVLVAAPHWSSVPSRR
jgi:hypothetical protein